MRVLAQQAFYKLLQLQFFLPTTFRNLHTNSLPSAMNPAINRTISFWFDGEDPIKRWFMPNPDLDKSIRDQFGTLVDQAHSSQLESWTQEPRGTLALLLLLDQFPRNIFRGSPRSYSSDAKAVQVTTRAIATGQDRQVSSLQQMFFYLPLMHDENLISQIAATALYEGLIHRCEPGSKEQEMAQMSVGHARRHMETILRFGRYPSRNAVLGRESSEEELVYLKEHPDGF